MKIKEAISQSMIIHGLKLCQHELELDNLPLIEFIDESCIDGNGKKTFGQFDGSTIKVVIKDRHPIDILRTLAHELTHWKQRLSNIEMNGEDGSETENQANAIAGIILRKFSEKYPEYFINTLP